MTVRVDIAYHAAIYFPDEFPTVDAFSKLTQYSTPAPLTGEAISAAMMSELAWNSDEHLQSIEDQGLVPLSPLMSSGDYWTACGADGTVGGRLERAPDQDRRHRAHGAGERDRGEPGVDGVRRDV